MVADPHESESSAERLRDILGLVNEWLRFAEAKNGGVVVAGCGLGIGLLPLVVVASGAAFWYGVAVVVQLAAAAAIGLVSFLPTTHVGKLWPYSEKRDEDNLLYFGHIAKYAPKFLAESVRDLEGLERAAPTPLEKILSEQTVVNARIATWKFSCANWAIRLLLSAIVTPVGVVLAGLALKERT